MRTLYEAIERHAPSQYKALARHLNEVGIRGWQDLTKVNLADFRDHLNEVVASSSAKTYMATLKAVMGRYADEGVLPFLGYAEVLRTRAERPVKTYLTPTEIATLAKVACKNDNERYVLDEFIVGCKTGCRHSDLERLTEENAKDGLLTYTSQKTGITATIPVSADTTERIARLRTNGRGVALVNYNLILRRLCKRAGITERVRVHKGGKDIVGEKWEFISSHSARVSLCTNLADAGVSLNDIATMAGHTNIAMTQNYIVRHAPKLNDRAKAYFE